LFSRSKAANFINSPGKQRCAGLKKFDCLLLGVGFLEFRNSFVECGKLCIKPIEPLLILIVGLNRLQDSLFSHGLHPLWPLFWVGFVATIGKTKVQLSAESLAASDTETARMHLMGGASDTFFPGPEE
jgi:hypothetical protein